MRNLIDNIFKVEVLVVKSTDFQLNFDLLEVCFVLGKNLYFSATLKRKLQRNR